MSDKFRKFEAQVTQDCGRAVAALGAAYGAAYYLEYVDVEYGRWVTWLLTPLIITFLLPAVILVLIYTSAVICYVYRIYRRLRLREGVQGDWKGAARLAVCALWDAHGWLWHGYEISGLENIPEGPCLFIYYHGALPIDMYYFIGRLCLMQGRIVHTVADRFMFKIPGWSIVLDNLCVIPGTVQSCSGILRAGNKLAISPGGVWEAQFSDHHYQLNWKSRIGFAKVALDAKVPIVPLFTQNVREAFRTVGWLRWLWLRIYTMTRVPLAPVYGGFPVKLTTHVGAPIHHDPALTPQQLQHKVKRAIEELIQEHQRVPGSILRALVERVYRVPKHPRRQTNTANGRCNGSIPHAANGAAEHVTSESVDCNEVDHNNDAVTSDGADKGEYVEKSEKLVDRNGLYIRSEINTYITCDSKDVDEREKESERNRCKDVKEMKATDAVDEDIDVKAKINNIEKVVNVNVENEDETEAKFNVLEKAKKSYNKDSRSDDEERMKANDKASVIVSNLISELIDKVSERANANVFHESILGEVKSKVS